MIELAPNHKRGLILESPLLNTAGTLGFDPPSGVDLAALGAFVTNPITPHARTPAHPPNACSLPNGVWIHTGLPNPGLDRIIRRQARHWARLPMPVIVHLAAHSPAEAQRCAERLENVDNVGGLELGFVDTTTSADLQHLIRATVGGVPILARLPFRELAAVEQHLPLAEAALRAGADALTISAPPRILYPLAQDADAPHGRLYSPDLFPATLAAVQTLAAHFPNVPIIGASGVFELEHAQALLTAGASAVQLDAVLWRHPHQALGRFASLIKETL